VVPPLLNWLNSAFGALRSDRGRPVFGFPHGPSQMNASLLKLSRRFCLGFGSSPARISGGLKFTVPLQVPLPALQVMNHWMPMPKSW
jgi:hypothetical protein